MDDSLEEELQCLIESGVSSWDLTGNGLADEGVQRVVQLLKTSSAVRGLDFGKNAIGDEGVKLIAGLLAANRWINSISLRHNSFGDEGLVALVDVLKTSQSVREVDLSGNTISDDGARAIAELLRANPGIQHLDLNDCEISDAGVRAIVSVLQSLTSLPTIRMDRAMMDIRSAGDDARALKLMNTENFQRALRATQCTGQAPLLRSRLVFVGEGQSGKTATLNSLLGIPFHPNMKPTQGASVRHCDCHPLGSYDFWPVKYDIVKEQYDLWAEAAVMEVRAFERGAGTSAGSSASGPPVGTVELARALRAQSDGETRPLRVAVWDCGSQPDFCGFHHATFTKQSVYVVVFNMEALKPKSSSAWRHTKKWLADPAEERQSQALRALRDWVRTVQLHAPGCPVILVGTHKDKVSGADHGHLNTMLEEVLIRDADSETQTKRAASIVRNKADKLWFIPVDNVLGLKDEAVKRLHDLIKATILKQDYLLDKVTVNEFRALEALSGSQRAFLPLEVAEALAGDEVQMDALELHAALARFHQLGLVLWWRADPQLASHVVLEPQWFADAMMCLLQDSHRLHREAEAAALLPDVEKWQFHGLVSGDLLQLLWPASSYDEASHAFLLDALQRLRVLCPWPGARPLWLLPGQFAAHHPPVRQRLMPWAKSQTILVDFSASFFPVGLFPHLVCHLAQQQVKAAQDDPAGAPLPPPIVHPADAWFHHQGTLFSLQWDAAPAVIRCEVLQRLTGAADANHTILKYLSDALAHVITDVAPDLPYSIRVPSAREANDATGKPQYCSPDEVTEDSPFSHWLPASSSPFSDDQARAQVQRLLREGPEEAVHVLEREVLAYQKAWRHMHRVDPNDLKDTNALVEELRGMCPGPWAELRQPTFGATSTIVNNFDYVDRLYGACAARRPDFEQRLSAIAGKVAAVQFHPTPALKPLPRCLEKAFFCCEGDVARVTDVLRCRLTAKEPYTVAQFLRRLLAELRAATDGLRIAGIESKLRDDFPADRTTGGWRDVVVVFFVPEGDGLLGELQIQLKGFVETRQDSQKAVGSITAAEEQTLTYRRAIDRVQFERRRLAGLPPVSATVTATSPVPPATVTRQPSVPALSPEVDPALPPPPGSPDPSPVERKRSSFSRGAREFFSSKLHRKKPE